MRLVSRGFAALAAVLVMVLPAFAEGPIPERRIAISRNVDFYGADLANIFDVTLEACQIACLSNARCEAFTYNSRSQACFPKSSISERVEYEGAISAQVLASDPKVLAQADARAGELSFLSSGDLARARDMADSLPRDHAVGAWSVEDFLRSQQKARNEDRLSDARWFTGAAIVLSDAPDLWVDYAVQSLEFAATRKNDKRKYQLSAIDASINGYLRAESAPIRASALAVMAQAFETQGRGRDMIPALRLAQALQPRDDTARALDKAIGKYGFRVIEHRVDSDAAQPRICAEFSQSLVESGVDYEPFVQAEEAGLIAEADGHQLCLSGVKHGARYRVTLREGLPAASGEVLARSVDLVLYVRDREPKVWFPGRGYILPAGGPVALPLSGVNVSEVALELSKVSDRNLVRAVQEDFFGARMSYWTGKQFNREIAQEIWSGTGTLEMQLNTDVTTRLPIGEGAGALEPGVYVLSARVPGADDYDDPTATQWFVVSDLGLATMRGTDGLHVFVRALGSADPLEGAEVTLLSQANAVLGTAISDAQGYALFAPGLSRGLGAKAPAMVSVKRADAAGELADLAFLPLEGPAFDLSDRGVEGRAPAGPIDVFLTTDRGAYRAGEVIHATALARDPQVAALEGLPLTAVLSRPDGVEYSRGLAQSVLAGGHVFALPIGATAPRGTWRLALYSDPQAPSLAEEVVLVEDFLPERIDFDLALPEGDLQASDHAPLSIDARYLYGAPAGGLEIEGDVQLIAARGLANYPGYRFGRHDQRFDPIGAGLPAGMRTDALGQAIVELRLPAIDQEGRAARPLEARITARISEGSGRPVEREIIRAVAPTGAMIGIKPAFEEELGEGALARFDVISLGANGAPAAMDMVWEVNRLTTNYQWYRSGGNWNWEPVTSRKRIASGEITSLSDGAPVQIEAQTDWGQYELRITRADGGAYTAGSVGFSAGWYAAEGATDTPDMLQVSLDAKAYAVGDTARLRITARDAGKALITVMSNRLIDMKAVDLAQGESEIDLPVTDEWGAGAYVTATLIRPLDRAGSRNPSRALGLAYAPVAPGKRALKVAFDMPAEAAPRGPMDIALRVSGAAPGEQIFATIAAVDVGILNLTGFTAPDPSEYYFGQRRLGMRLRDIYGRLIDGMSGAMGTVRSGGDAMAQMRMQSPPPTQELMAAFSGPLEVGADSMARAQIDLPAFNGTVRLMAVAWSLSAVGQADTDILVRDPVVLTATVPRFMAPGDRARMLLEIAHAKGPSGPIELGFVADGLALDLRGLSQDLEIIEGQKLALNIPFEALSPGDHSIKISLKTPGGEQLSQRIAMAVRRNDPEITQTRRLSLAPGKSFTLSRDVFTGLAPGTGRASLAIGPLARFDVPGLLQALDRYPYGCTEQVTSRALPLLYLDEVATAMGLGSRDQVSLRISQAIGAVLANQDSNGAFGLWGAGSGDLWLDAYVSDFLSRARAQGHDIPDKAFRGAMDNLRNRVNYAADFDEGGGELAYALYVLAREGAASVGDLRYYADVKRDAFTTPLGAAQLGAALAAYGDPTRADRMFRRAGALLADQGEESRQTWRADYGTPQRDAAAVLTLAVEAGSSAVDRESLSARLSPRAGTRALSTQERVWQLLAANALIGDGGGAEGILLNGAVPSGPLVRALDDQPGAQNAVFENSSARDVQLTLTTFGIPEVAEPAGGNGYAISREYYSMEGARIDPANVEQGARMVAVLNVQPWSKSEARLMISDPLPAGFEIDNPNLLRAGDIAALDWLKVMRNTETTEFRADRFLAAVDWRSQDAFRLAYVVRAITPGAFHHPAASVEDMYRPTFRAHSETGRVVIAAQ
ncbi:MAG: alpha-2-macroglobulin family protein [Paracoccaceae bacterium]